MRQRIQLVGLLTHTGKVEPLFDYYKVSLGVANGAESENSTHPKSESLHTAAIPSAIDQSLRAEGKRK